MRADGSSYLQEWLGNAQKIHKYDRTELAACKIKHEMRIFESNHRHFAKMVEYAHFLVENHHT